MSICILFLKLNLQNMEIALFIVVHIYGTTLLVMFNSPKTGGFLNDINIDIRSNRKLCDCEVD